jgi:hypothetical protein
MRGRKGRGSESWGGLGCGANPARLTSECMEAGASYVVYQEKRWMDCFILMVRTYTRAHACSKVVRS